MLRTRVSRSAISAVAAAKNAQKTSTGITGLAVDPNARQTLIDLYKQTLKEVQALPEDAEYRKSVEAFTKHRLSVCEKHELHDEIEDELEAGQVEELIEQAKDELELIPIMAEAKPWEPYTAPE